MPVFFTRRARSVFAAFTVIEMLVVVAILGILAALLFPNFQYILVRAEGVVCTEKLRNLYAAFSSSLNDGNGWPQVPAGIQIGSTAEQQWWIDSSSNTMGLKSNDWQCPTLSRSMKNSSNTLQQSLICYLPTLFDNIPGTPRNWSAMPWFTEIANVHGSGNLMIRADGSVIPSSAGTN